MGDLRITNTTRNEPIDASSGPFGMHKIQAEMRDLKDGVTLDQLRNDPAIQKGLEHDNLDEIVMRTADGKLHMVLADELTDNAKVGDKIEVDNAGRKISGDVVYVNNEANQYDKAILEVGGGAILTGLAVGASGGSLLGIISPYLGSQAGLFTGAVTAGTVAGGGTFYSLLADEFKTKYDAVDSITKKP